MEMGLAIPSENEERDPLQAAALRARAGEAGAFEDLVTLSDLKILGLAWRLLGDRDLAKDAAQEVYLRIHRSLGSFRPSDSFRAWMNRITVHVCFDLMRKRGPFTARLDDLESELALHSGADHAEEALLLDQRRTFVQRALQSLGPAERAALVLRDLEGLSAEEVGRALGIKAATVRGHASTARAKLQALCARWTSNPGRQP